MQYKPPLQDNQHIFSLRLNTVSYTILIVFLISFVLTKSSFHRSSNFK